MLFWILVEVFPKNISGMNLNTVSIKTNDQEIRDREFEYATEQ